MQETNRKDPVKNNDPRDGFTGMPQGNYPNFEPQNSKEKQLQQFEDTAENGKVD